jgi:hypothetical protein
MRPKAHHLVEQVPENVMQDFVDKFNWKGDHRGRWRGTLTLSRIQFGGSRSLT